jgi:hypothetical protein
MENLENQNFEAEWRKAFAGAEVTPSDAVWDAINMRSLHIENLAMRKRVVFYQRLAAASVAILFLFSGYFLLKPSATTSNKNLTQEKTGQANSNSPATNNNTQTESKEGTEVQSGQALSSTQTANNAEDNNPALENERSVAKNIVEKTSPEIAKTKDDLSSNTNGISNQSFQSNTRVTNLSDRNSNADNNLGVNADGIPNQPQPILAQNLTDKTESVNDQVGGLPVRKSLGNQGPIASVHSLPIESMLLAVAKPNDLSIAYRIADATPVINRSKKKSIKSENMWAAVGFAAGNYSSNATGGELLQASRAPASSGVGAPFTESDATARASSENQKPGYSMAYSIAAGKRIFKKWVLQGGITYLNQSANSIASVPSVAPVNQVLGSGELKDFDSPETTYGVTYTTQNEIKSTTQFISMPIQAGYMIVDRKIGVQLNGGISPDFFLRNSVYENGKQSESLGASGDTNKSYNAISLAGLGGLEVSYQFSKHYRISLVPGFRYSLTPVYKESSLASTKPFVADIGIRFRYLFSK